MLLRRPALTLLVAGAALLLGAAACTGAEAPRPRAAATIRLPAVAMLDVGSSRQVDLSTFQPRGDKALLVWAWAPHCPYCRREAPAVEQFARQHADRLQVIGVGTQDTAADARAFRTETGIGSFPLLYEADGFRSWEPFGFAAQPAATLLGRSGRVLHTWTGPFDEADVLRLIDA